MLTQCENLIALRCIGKHDRDAAADWIAEVVHDTESQKKADQFTRSLTELENGDAWFWSPQWLKEFVHIHFRMRKSHHPGETRSVGQAAQQVQMVAVKDFVESFKRTLKRPMADKVTFKGVPEAHRLGLPVSSEYSEEAARLREENSELRAQVAQLTSIIGAIRAAEEPEYRRLQALFGNLDKVSANGHHADREVWEPWKQKLGKRPGMMIEALLQRGELTRTQLATLTEQSPNSGGYANNLSMLNRNGLLEKHGDKLRLRKI